MGTYPTTTIRIDPELKNQAGKIFDDLGIGMSAAINAFLKSVVREGGIPFDMKATPPTPPKPYKNTTLTKAFIGRKDEFYTRFEDIAEEMKHYPESFTGKKILCNCDDPFESAFFRYFALNFNELGIERLTSTCYSGSAIMGQEYPISGGSGAYKAIINEMPDVPLIRPDNSLDLESVFAIPGNNLSPLKGDGDFRSEECVSLLQQADIVATNPPFSLFRDYIALLQEHDVKFIVLGNMNASTYKEIFPLIRENVVWYGESIRSGDRKFYVPESYPLNAAGCGVDSNGRRYIKVKGVRWFTNIENSRRHETLELNNLYSSEDYKRYENYNAIDVGRTCQIPSDFTGFMGVPITFLDKYSPDQFEILMLANGNARTNVSKETLEAVGYRKHPEDRGGVGIVDGKRSYARIIIRKK